MVNQEYLRPLRRAASTSEDFVHMREETNIFKALTWTWLCPSLMQLRIAADLQVTDLVPLARARGGRYAESISAGLTPNRLRYLEAPLCPSGSSQEIEWLKELVDEVRCGCLSCQFDISRKSFGTWWRFSMLIFCIV